MNEFFFGTVSHCSQYCHQSVGSGMPILAKKNVSFRLFFSLNVSKLASKKCPPFVTLCNVNSRLLCQMIKEPSHNVCFVQFSARVQNVWIPNRLCSTSRHSADYFLFSNFRFYVTDVDLRVKPYNRWNALAGHTILEVS